MNKELTENIGKIMKWFREDPRYSINKRADIIIVRPFQFVGYGQVDTKEGWCIFTSFEDHKCISVDDNWDQDWIWTWAPNKYNTFKNLD